MLSEEQYVDQAERELSALIEALDALPDGTLDAELANGILTLDFGDDLPIVINSHRAARQIWMAADRTAWHFSWDPNSRTWVAERSGDELWSALESRISARLGSKIALKRPT
jgi:CyaY protein